MNRMALDEQRSLFKSIALGSVRNMIGFAAAVAVIAYLAGITGVRKPAMLLAVITVLIMLVTINAFIMFTYYTLKSIPAARRENPGESFSQVYGYTLVGIAIRLVEVILYICLIVYLYKVFFM